MPTLRFDDVTFQYASGRRVLESFDLHATPGEMLVLRGRNGVGKTTLLRLAAGLLRPSRGRVVREGTVVHVPSNLQFHESLTVHEEVQWLSAVGDLEVHAIEESMAAWGFAGALHESEISSLSTGWRQRLAFAIAAASRGTCILLDEPLANLDRAGTEKLGDWLSGLLARNAVVVLAQHGELGPLENLPLREHHITGSATGAHA